MDEQSVSDVSDSQKPKSIYKSYRRRCVLCKTKQTDDISMHRIPKNEVWRKMWCDIIKRDISDSSRVCSHHFISDDFRPGNRKMLKFDAVPSRNLQGKFIRIPQKKSSKYQVSVQLSPSKKHTASIKLENRSSSKKPSVTIKMEDGLSDDDSASTDSELDLCYIYYLDEHQNVRFYKTYRETIH